MANERYPLTWGKLRAVYPVMWGSDSFDLNKLSLIPRKQRWVWRRRDLTMSSLFLRLWALKCQSVKLCVSDLKRLNVVMLRGLLQNVSWSVAAWGCCSWDGDGWFGVCEDVWEPDGMLGGENDCCCVAGGWWEWGSRVCLEVDVKWCLPGWWRE